VRRKEPTELEVVVRFREPYGISNEWVFRVKRWRVELIAYWPNGSIEQRDEMSFEKFHQYFRKHWKPPVGVKESRP